MAKSCSVMSNSGEKKLESENFVSESVRSLETQLFLISGNTALHKFNYICQAQMGLLVYLLFFSSS